MVKQIDEHCGGAIEEIASSAETNRWQSITDIMIKLYLKVNWMKDLNSAPFTVNGLQTGLGTVCSTGKH